MYMSEYFFAKYATKLIGPYKAKVISKKIETSLCLTVSL